MSASSSLFALAAVALPQRGDDVTKVASALGSGLGVGEHRRLAVCALPPADRDRLRPCLRRRERGGNFAGSPKVGSHLAEPLWNRQLQRSRRPLLVEPDLRKGRGITGTLLEPVIRLLVAATFCPRRGFPCHAHLGLGLSEDDPGQGGWLFPQFHYGTAGRNQPGNERNSASVKIRSMSFSQRTDRKQHGHAKLYRVLWRRKGKKNREKPGFLRRRAGPGTTPGQQIRGFERLQASYQLSRARAGAAKARTLIQLLRLVLVVRLDDRHIEGHRGDQLSFLVWQSSIMPPVTLSISISGGPVTNSPDLIG